MTDTWVVVVDPAPAPMQVIVADAERYDVTVSNAPGPPGPPGPGGDLLVHDQSVAAATWTIPHLFGRWPDVTVYTLAGARIEPDIEVSDTAAVLTFSTPTTGKAVLT